jgi:preprotein translocase subunit SecF
MPSPPNIVELRQKLGGLSLGDVSIQQFGKEQDLLVKLEKSEEGSEQSEAVKKIKDVLGQDVVYKKIETVGPKVGSELIANAIKAVIFALIAMLGYIMLRFEWQFGVCAVAALVHDCAVIFGMFSIFPLEFNEMSITAILLTASYSVNDTVVIFDRIRENLKRFRKLNMKDVVNKSLNETLSRTTLTATTTLLAVFALYLLGGKVIAAFSLPILIGIIVGTFSSVFIASPLLVFMNIDRGDGDNRSTEEKQRAPANLQ